MSEARIPVVFLVLFAIVACTSGIGSNDEIRFSHNLHKEMGADCANCHWESAEQLRVVIPTKPSCTDCHDVDSNERCEDCHRNPSAPGGYQQRDERGLLFSHALHKDVEQDCTVCHVEGAQQKNVTTMPGMPDHDNCGACHDDWLNRGQCDSCHHQLYRFARRPEKYFSHKMGFFESHGLQAAGDSGTCALCHDDAYCADCHDDNAILKPSVQFANRVERRFIHQGDWMSRHAIEAAHDNGRCLKCHGISRCASCHEQNGAGAALPSDSPHPDATIWMGGGAKSHGAEARRNILSCASCHDQGAYANCVACHAEGGVNPHPNNWQSPVPFDQRDGHPMCAICHQ